MQRIRQVIDDAPEQVAIPPDLRHRRIEVIIWPLDDAESRSRRPSYLRAKVDKIEIPSREERNARR
jgi:hypothetical protein